MELFVIIFLILAIIIGIVLFFIFKKKDIDKVGVAPDKSQFTLSNYYIWSSEVSKDKYKNYCQVYDLYPTTLQASVLDNVPGQSLPCFYSDQYAAVKMTKTCKEENVKGGTGYINLCVKPDGTLASPGDSYNYYDTDPCKQSILPCPGFMGIFSLPFFEGATSNQVAQSCINFSDNSFVNCDINSHNQLVNATNYSYSFKGFYQDNSGPFTQLNVRSANKCLKGITLTDCSATPEWIIVPAYTLYFYYDSSFNFTGPRDPGATVPSGYTGITVTFPQAYVDSSTVNLTTLGGFTTIAQITNYLYNTVTVKVLGKVNNSLVTISYQDALKQMTGAIQSPKLPDNGIVYIINANFVGYQLFNFIKNI